MKDPDFTPKKQWMLSSARFFMPHCGNFRATGNLKADNHLIFQLIYYSRWFYRNIHFMYLQKIWIQSIHSIIKQSPIGYKVPMCGKSKHIYRQTI
jgi:hypothetical protein